MLALVCAEHVSGGVNHLPLARQADVAALEQPCVVVVGNEADFLRIGLVKDGEVQLAGNLAHCGLLHLADGKERSRELIARDAEEDVRLVLGAVDAAGQARAIITRDDPRVVAGGHEVAAELGRVVVELAELEPVVAANARIGRAAACVLILEVADDATKVLLEVDDVEGNVEPCGDEACIAGVVDRAASLMPDLEGLGGSGHVARRGVDGRDLVERFSRRAETHKDPNDIEAAPLQQRRGNGRVNASRHGKKYFGHGRGEG